MNLVVTVGRYYNEFILALAKRSLLAPLHEVLPAVDYRLEAYILYEKAKRPPTSTYKRIL